MKSNIKNIVMLFKDFRSEVCHIFLCLAVLIIINFCTPFISQHIIDDGLIDKNSSMLIILCILLFVLYFLSSIIEIIKERKRLYIYNNIKKKLQFAAFDHLTKIRFDYFNDKNSSNIHKTIEDDISSISAIASSDTFDILTSFVLAISGAVALFFIDWRLTLAVISFIPINALVTSIATKKMFNVSYDYFKFSREYSQWYGDSINGIKEIRFFNLRKSRIKKLIQSQEKLLDMSEKQGMLRIKNEKVQHLLLELMSISIYILAGIVLVNQNISMGAVVAFESYALMMSEPIISGFKLLFEVTSLFPSISRFFEFMDYEEELSGNKFIEYRKFDYEFKNVCFSYINGKEIFSDVNIKINSGEKIAVIGANGAGKTTFINLILRILTPTSGDIYLSSVNYKEYNLEDYRDNINIVSQEVYLFNSSIYDNICLGRKIDKKELYMVISKVNLTSLIEQKGFDYNVGENGKNLSGGQKQKIGIARALIVPKPILILDEATSNLDKETVEILMRVITNDYPNTTVICITHSKHVEKAFPTSIKVADGKLIKMERK